MSTSKDDPKACKNCDGRGMVPVRTSYPAATVPFNFDYDWRTCNQCKGSGLK